jgi:hypothetical protein
VIWSRRARPRYGCDWITRILDGVKKVYEPGETLVVAPRRFGLKIRTIVLFNFRDRPVGASMRFRRRDGDARLDVTVPAGGARRLVPRDAGSERDDLFRGCDQILVDARGDGPCASTYFVSHEALHVFFMNEGYRDELPDIVTRYASSDFTLVQGGFVSQPQPEFPDDHEAQRRLYDQARRRFPESRRVLSAPGFALPEPCRIPRSIQWIWLRSPRPLRLHETHVRRMHSWARHNPSFGLNVWTDLDDFTETFRSRAARRLFQAVFGDRIRVRGPAEVEALFGDSTLPNAARLHDLFERVANVAPRSDVLRLMVLEADGGVYCDMNDTECLAPIHDFCDRFSFVAGLDFRNRIHNAIVGSARNHPIVRDWLSSVQESATALNRELATTVRSPQYFFAVLRACGPYTLSQRLCALLDEGRLGSDVLLLPFPFFHNPEPREPTPLSVAIHHSSMSWLPRRPGMVVHWLPGALRARVLRWASSP